MTKENKEDIREIFTYSNFKKIMVEIQEIKAENKEIKSKYQEIESENIEIKKENEAMRVNNVEMQKKIDQLMQFMNKAKSL